MPIFRCKDKLAYYAHVPKCGGSSIADYIESRFGRPGFHSNNYHSTPEALRWTRSSPQHVDWQTMEQLMPFSLFDAIFSVVRHPVPRIVSTYHFQLEVEKEIAPDMSFSDWLAELDVDGQPYAYDNHILPMSRIVPEGATVFHLEHGLDPLILWFDLLTDAQDQPRAIGTINQRGAHVAVKPQKVVPSDADLARIYALYAEDFERFGYDLNAQIPKAEKPEISSEFVRAKEAELKRMNMPLARLQRAIRARARKHFDL